LDDICWSVMVTETPEGPATCSSVGVRLPGKGNANPHGAKELSARLPRDPQPVCRQGPHLTYSVYKVVFKKSIPSQIRQLILKNEG